MLKKSIESSISIEQSSKQKRKLRLIIVSKGGKSDKIKDIDEKEEKEKDNSKITFQNQKGRFEIRIENYTQTLDKNKIDKTVKSLMKNISVLNIDNKNKELINNTAENMNELIANENNNFYDIYLEKKRKKQVDKNLIIYPNKKEIIEEDNIFFKKIKIDEGENEAYQNDTDYKKDSNRDLLKNQNSKEKIIYDSSNEKKDTNNLLNVKSNSFNINNIFKDDKNKNENSASTIKNEDKNNMINNIQKNENNIISRNVNKQLISTRDLDIINQSTKNMNKAEQNMSSNSNLKINYNFDNNINIQIKKGIHQFTCSICDITYTSSLSYVAECFTHILCKKCAKCFFEEKIESGIKELFCPFISCGKKFSKEQAMKFLSKSHIDLLEEKKEKNGNLNSIKFLNDDDNEKNIKIYSKNHVIDINNNKLFYNFNKNKSIYCSKCHKYALFCREKQNFMRCLNCHFKQCKYCFKEYTKEHFDMVSQNYCKVYYRNDDIFRIKLNKIIDFLKQILFIFAIFFLAIISPWVLSKKYFTNSLLKRDNHDNYKCFLYCIKIIFIYFLSFFIFIIFLPITVLLFPYFPSFLTIFDFK